ncbi:MAG: iron-containing alcohol dehydrogenase [Blastocatellia bacterium]|nr:iron-containing alcohol dehydrogenase [Blastocatellia bacterium]
MEAFDFQARTRMVFGVGAFERLGDLAREIGFRRTLLVTDAGMVACGYADEARASLAAAGIEVFSFTEFGENPDTAMVEAGRGFAAERAIDSIVALGGGSSMDCAKGINFVLTNGGAMRDYLGYAKTTRPMLPMIGVPTTAGTGSDAQSYALISDAETHAKMACGDPGAAFRIALLDPRLTVTMPPALTALSGYDAIAHAVESYVTRKGTLVSQMLAMQAWRLLHPNFRRVLSEPANLEARGEMLLGSYLAGLAIENSMLGAAHACANPLTQHFGTTHGAALGVFLPAVVAWNIEEDGGRRYLPLAESARLLTTRGLVSLLEDLAIAGKLPRRLRELGVRPADLSMLAEGAATQWTGGFNPRGWSLEGAKEVYAKAY